MSSHSRLGSLTIRLLVPPISTSLDGGTLTRPQSSTRGHQACGKPHPRTVEADDRFANSAARYGAAIGLLDAHAVEQVGVAGSAKWGAHAAIAFAAVGFDARKAPASYSTAGQGRRRQRGRFGSRAGAGADPRPRPSMWCLRAARHRDRSRARTPPSVSARVNAGFAARSCHYRFPTAQYRAFVVRPISVLNAMSLRISRAPRRVAELRGTCLIKILESPISCMS